MLSIINNLINDEAGFIVSSELVLVGSIAVLAMIVGLSEVALNVTNELEDVGSAMGSVNQTYHVSGLAGHMSTTGGSCFSDLIDFCDSANDIGLNTQDKGEATYAY